MHTLSKKTRKQVRELIGTVYERELSYHMNELAKKFDEWRQNQIDCWDLSDLIHKFHDGISRELYNRYTSSFADHYLLTCAIKNGFLQKEELSAEILELIGPFDQI